MSRTSSSSNDTQGLSGNVILARVVLPDCRGPYIDTTGNSVANVSSSVCIVLRFIGVNCIIFWDIMKVLLSNYSSLLSAGSERYQFSLRPDVTIATARKSRLTNAFLRTSAARARMSQDEATFRRASWPGLRHRNIRPPPPTWKAPPHIQGRGELSCLRESAAVSSSDEHLPLFPNQ